MDTTDKAALQATFADGPPQPVGRPLGWWYFTLQFGTVLLAFLLCSVPPVLLWGQTSFSVGLSTATSMAGALLVAWLWLRRDGAVTEAFRIERPASWPRTLAISAAATGVIMAIFAVGAPVVQALGLQAPEVEGVIDMVIETPLTFAFSVVVVAWFSAGFGEEMVWRGFLFDRLTRLRGLGSNMALVLVVQAVLFGLPHIYQGVGGVLITGTIGLFLGWLRIVLKGNLWANIIAHGAVDTIMLSLGYMESLGWYGG